MTDDKIEAPYERAIEETAKTTGKAIDLVHSMGPAISNAYGFLIGDHVTAARERNLDKISRKTKKILHDRDVAEQQPIPEAIGIPLLEAAKGETREVLQDIFAGLLANAMDPKLSDNVRPEFIDTVKKWQPLDGSRDEPSLQAIRFRG
jgi:hypothetical protein